MVVVVVVVVVIVVMTIAVIVVVIVVVVVVARLKFMADPSTDPEANPLSVSPKHTPKRAKQAYPVVWGMFASWNPYVCSIRRVCFLHFVRKMCPCLRI